MKLKDAEALVDILAPLLAGQIIPLIEQINLLKAEVAELKTLPRVTPEDVSLIEERLDTRIDDTDAYHKSCHNGLAKRIDELPQPQPVEVDVITAKTVETVLAQVTPRLNEVIDLVKAIEPAPALPDIPAMIAEEVQSKSLTSDDFRPMIEELVAQKVKALPEPEPGKDGRGAAAAIIDKSGHLILTMTDGTLMSLGPVVGKDVDMGEVKQLILDEVAKIPAPTNGKDGLDLKNITLSHSRKGFTLTLKDDEREVSSTIELPVLVWRDIYKSDEEYLKGDIVTWGGSAWHCEVDGAKGHPGTSDSWKLMVKKGRDGKDVVRALPKEGPVKAGDVK